MFFSINHIIQWLLTYRYAVLLPITIVEGPIITIISGFLCSLGYFNFILTYLIIVIGDLIGDSLYYLIGYGGRTHFIQRWGHYVGLNLERTHALEEHFSTHAGKTLFIGKISHAPGAAILAAAGASKMPYPKFIGYSTLATLPKSLFLLVIGFYFGKAYVKINNYVTYFTLIVGALVFLSLLFYWLWRKFWRDLGLPEEKTVDQSKAIE